MAPSCDFLPSVPLARSTLKTNGRGSRHAPLERPSHQLLHLAAAEEVLLLTRRRLHAANDRVQLLLEREHVLVVAAGVTRTERRRHNSPLGVHRALPRARDGGQGRRGRGRRHVVELETARHLKSGAKRRRQIPSLG